ncbi:sensory rhodopsin-2, partial [Halobacteriales archaeon QS_1_68_17]
MVLGNITTWFWLGTAGMALGTGLLAWSYLRVSSDDDTADLLLIGIGAIATVAYLGMALGVGRLGIDGRPVFWPRYLDWLLTTPMHVVYVGLLVDADRRRLGTLAALQAATIVFGFAGAVTAPPVKWLGFLAGSATFVGVVYLLYGPLTAAAAG